jgi:hypothetical protein
MFAARMFLSVQCVTGLWAAGCETENSWFDSWKGKDMFYYYKASRRTWVSSNIPCEWWGWIGQSVKLTTRRCLVPVYLHDEHRGNPCFCSCFVGAVSDLFIVLSVMRAYKQQLKVDGLNTHMCVRFHLYKVFSFLDVFVVCTSAYWNLTLGKGLVGSRRGGRSAEWFHWLQHFFLPA